MAPVRSVVVGLVVVAMTASVGCRGGDDPPVEATATTVGQVTIGSTASTSTTEAALDMGMGGGPQRRELGQAAVLERRTLRLRSESTVQDPEPMCHLAGQETVLEWTSGQTEVVAWCYAVATDEWAWEFNLSAGDRCGSGT